MAWWVCTSSNPTFINILFGWITGSVYPPCWSMLELRQSWSELGKNDRFGPFRVKPLRSSICLGRWSFRPRDPDPNFGKPHFFLPTLTLTQKKQEEKTRHALPSSAIPMVGLHIQNTTGTWHHLMEDDVPNRSHTLACSPCLVPTELCVCWGSCDICDPPVNQHYETYIHHFA